LTRPSHTSDEALYDLRRAILIATMLAALGGGTAAAQSSLQLEGSDGQRGGNSYDVLPAGVLATEDGCNNLWRGFDLTDLRPANFLVYSRSGITGENFTCLFQDDAKQATNEWDSPEPEWSVTGKCEGRNLAPSGTANFTIEQMSDDELHSTRKLADILFAEDFGTFAHCPKAG